MVHKPDNILDTIISRNVIRLREERGWSQDDLAERYGCTFQYISQMETGHRGFGKRTFKRLMAAFGVTEKELLEMPQGLVSAEMRDQWETFSQLHLGERKDLFSRVLSLMADGTPEAMESLEGLVKILEKNLAKGPQSPR